MNALGVLRRRSSTTWACRSARASTSGSTRTTPTSTSVLRARGYPGGLSYSRVARGQLPRADAGGPGRVRRHQAPGRHRDRAAGADEAELPARFNLLGLYRIALVHPVRCAGLPAVQGLPRRARRSQPEMFVAVGRRLPLPARCTSRPGIIFGVQQPAAFTQPATVLGRQQPAARPHRHAHRGGARREPAVSILPTGERSTRADLSRPRRTFRWDLSETSPRSARSITRATPTGRRSGTT